MSKELTDFVKTHFFTLKKINNAPDSFIPENVQLNVAFSETGVAGKIWQDALSDMEVAVGSPIDQWHAGHLARMKGETLPVWEKRDAYIGGFGKTQRLEELQRQAAETLSKMKYALIRETLTRHAQLYDADVQTRMTALLKEMYTVSRKDPMLFLENLANRRFLVHSYGNLPKPNPQWSKNDKTTELVCQLANLTFLEIQTSLQSDNEIEKNNVPTSPMADISVR